MLIPAQIFPISKLVGVDSARPAIHGVLVQRKEDETCTATATNGRYLLSVDWSDCKERSEYPKVEGSTKPVPEFEVVVPSKQWDEAAKLIPKSHKAILNRCLLDETPKAGSDKIHMSTTDLESERSVSADPVEGEYPKYEETIPKYTVGADAVEIVLDPMLLAELLQVMSKVLGYTKGTPNETVKLIVPDDPNRPIAIEGYMEDGIEVTGVLMACNPKGWREGQERKRP